MGQDYTRERALYETNPIVRTLNHRYPGLFRLLWEAYLARRARVRETDLPFHPTTPILQARSYSQRYRQSEPQARSQRVLFFSLVGWSKHIIMDGLIARALSMRGVEVDFFTCGGILPLCYIHNASSPVPPMPCGRCRAYADSGLQAFGFAPTMMKDLITADERAAVERRVAAIPETDLFDFVADDLPYGYFASVSARWFLLTNKVDQSPDMLQRTREFILLGMLSRLMIEKLIQRRRPDRIILFNGIQAPEQVVRRIAEREGIPYVCTERGYTPNSFFAAHNAPATTYPLDGLWERFNDLPLSQAEEARLDRYLLDRRRSVGDTDPLWQNVREDEEALRQELQIPPGRRIVSVFTNVQGDTALIDRDLGYSDITEWIDHVIALFRARPDLTLVFRIHPAESRLKRYTPRQSYGDYIQQRHPDLPEHIKVIPSSSTLSSYTLAGISDLVLVYASTIGLETTLMGKPTVVSARVHYRDKGFTLDVNQPDDLVTWIDRFQNEALPLVDREKARRYANMFFFRSMIPLHEIMEEKGFGELKLKLDGFEALQPGRIPAVDAICSAIIDGEPFVNPYPALQN
jgi:hypothetical protein